MAIRSRLKSVIKKALFGAQKSNTPTNRDSSPPPTSTFSTPNVSTEATIKTEQSLNTSFVEESDTTTKQTIVEPTKPLPSEQGDTKDQELIVEESVELDGASEPSADGEEKPSFVFEITDLFPEICGHCGDKTFNNWIRIESKFACESCGEVFE
jgi:hypothetical protein